MKKRSRQTAAPEITPLIDVVFLLLIFFMTSTVFKKDELALLLNLPKTEQGEGKSTQKSTIIELSQNEVALNGKKLTLDTIENEIRSFTDKKQAIQLRVDQKVEYLRLVKILDLLKRNKLTNLELVTDLENNR
ncbi:MAG: biopolymer transporter ExbD [Halobacteriovoraceae bacterium]|nr:biopolymer transporter ExbD [Halobacteriovoraceae bacterium]